MEEDQKILALLCQLSVDQFEFTNQWEIPDGQLALINFIGRGMKSILETPEKQKLHQLKRKPGFSNEDASRLVINLLLHTFRLAREVNKIRIEAGRPAIDWYERVIEEDQRG
jgi:hypothetical protein